MIRGEGEEMHVNKRKYLKKAGGGHHPEIPISPLANQGVNSTDGSPTLFRRGAVEADLHSGISD